jgi:hypothetical protein
VATKSGEQRIAMQTSAQFSKSVFIDRSSRNSHADKHTDEPACRGQTVVEFLFITSLFFPNYLFKDSY